LEVNVLCAPDRGKSRTAKVFFARWNLKEAAKPWLDEQKPHVRRPRRTRRQLSSKSDTCSKGADVDAAGLRVKVGVHYPGRSYSAR